MDDQRKDQRRARGAHRDRTSGRTSGRAAVGAFARRVTAERLLVRTVAVCALAAIWAVYLAMCLVIRLAPSVPYDSRFGLFAAGAWSAAVVVAAAAGEIRLRRDRRDRRE